MVNTPVALYFGVLRKPIASHVLSNVITDISDSEKSLLLETFANPFHFYKYPIGLSSFHSHFCLKIRNSRIEEAILAKTKKRSRRSKVQALKEESIESLQMAVEAATIPLLTPYKLGKFNLSHRYAISVALDKGEVDDHIRLISKLGFVPKFVKTFIILKVLNIYIYIYNPINPIHFSVFYSFFYSFIFFAFLKIQFVAN